MVKIKDKVLNKKNLKIGYRTIDNMAFAKSSSLCKQRINTLFIKEPTTIEWIKHFSTTDIFFDIGANVGMYTIFAAKTQKCKVVSFEPQTLNFAELNKNIYLNQLNHQVTAYPIALTNVTGLSKLYLYDFGIGESHNDVEENISKRKLIQGTYAARLDELDLPQPNHIKIDVDNFEYRVVEGALKTIENVDTILIEIDFKTKNIELIKQMEDRGWKWSKDQVRICQHWNESFENFKKHLWDKRKGGQNFIFFKDDKWFNIFYKFAKTFKPGNPIKMI